MASPAKVWAPGTVDADARITGRRHLAGQHDQKKHGRYGARGSVPSAVAFGQHGEIGVAIKQRLIGRGAAQMKREAAAAVAEHWDVDPKDAVLAAREAAPSRELDDIAFALGHPELYEIAREGSMYSVWAKSDVNPNVRLDNGRLVQMGVSGATGRVSMDTPEGRAMVKEAAASSLIGKWADTSNDHDVGALAVQEAIKREFGLDDAADWVWKAGENSGMGAQAGVNLIMQRHGPVLQSYARATYDSTQAELARRGITEVGVIRGYGGSRDPVMPPISAATMPLRPASAFSTEAAIAEQFGGVRLIASVPAERVLSTPITGMGCAGESEVVVLGGGNFQALRVAGGQGWVHDAVRGSGPEATLLDEMSRHTDTWEPGMYLDSWVASTFPNDPPTGVDKATIERVLFG